MVIIDSSIYRKLDDYIAYIVRENQCSRDRAKQKVMDILQSLENNLGGIVTHRISPYKQFGNPQGYRLFVYKDPKSKTQWGFAYEKFENGNVIVHAMTNMKLIKEFQVPIGIISLIERMNKLYI